jgi:hypothetical protein
MGVLSASTGQLSFQREGVRFRAAGCTSCCANPKSALSNPSLILPPETRRRLHPSPLPRLPRGRGGHLRLAGDDLGRGCHAGRAHDGRLSGARALARSAGMGPSETGGDTGCCSHEAWRQLAAGDQALTGGIFESRGRLHAVARFGTGAPPNSDAGALFGSANLVLPSFF